MSQAKKSKICFTDKILWDCMASQQETSVRGSSMGPNS